MKKLHALPALPLITHDPFFSLWDCGPAPTADEVRHWSGLEKPLRGTVTIDGLLMRWMGRSGRRPMHLKEINVTPLSTEYVMEELGVRITVKFTSPLLLNDLEVLSTPITYMDVDVEFIDGKEHEVKLTFFSTDSLVCANANVPRIRQDFFQDGDLKFGLMGQHQQKPLSGGGDHLTIDWGHLFFCSDGDCTIDDMPAANYNYLRWMKTFTQPGKATLLIGYDDIASINYFGRLLPAYYARNGKTIVEALTEFHARHDELMEKCAAFDKELTAEAEKLGGQDYVNVVIASYRQSIAAHKLVADDNGELLFISKENDSNGCAATVDVSYPSIPLYLLYCPELVRAMCRPIMKFCKMPIWKYDFAPHDVGRYPILVGQAYAAKNRVKGASEGTYTAPIYMYPSSVDAFKFETQMPVEECGNMILMLAAAGYADGDYTMCQDDLEILQTWCEYLLKYGEDPGEQLCTDDFTGHLAHNVNLSAKAVMGIAGFSHILEILGHKEEAAEYMAKARVFAESWLKRAFNGEYSYLTFEGVGWSQKYNLVWDKLFGWNLLPESFYEKEIASYMGRMNEYGLPLDNRADITKSDWSMWIAAMTDDEETFRKMVAPMAKFLAETPNRVPFSDFYDTVTGFDERFIGRSVQGGCFMPLLMKKWKKQ